MAVGHQVMGRQLIPGALHGTKIEPKKIRRGGIAVEAHPVLVADRSPSAGRPAAAAGAAWLYLAGVYG